MRRTRKGDERAAVKMLEGLITEEPTFAAGNLGGGGFGKR